MRRNCLELGFCHAFLATGAVNRTAEIEGNVSPLQIEKEKRYTNYRLGGFFSHKRLLFCIYTNE
jgi:hypothetical protein